MSDKMQHTGFRLTDMQRAKLDAEAQRRNRDRSWILREIIDKHYGIGAKRKK